MARYNFENQSSGSFNNFGYVEFGDDTPSTSLTDLNDNPTNGQSLGTTSGGLYNDTQTALDDFGNPTQRGAQHYSLAATVLFDSVSYNGGGSISWDETASAPGSGNGTEGYIIVNEGNGITFSIAIVFRSPAGDGTGFTPSLGLTSVGGHLEVIIYCFLAGTKILTSSGEVQVEDMREGDWVLTASGTSRQVRSINYRHVVASELKDAHLHAPVCIQKNAIAPSKPKRDLWVTPDHAIFVDGKLIPARMLVNGTTIRQEPRQRFSFYSIELDQHDLLLAEGLEAESYLDIGTSRQRFKNSVVTNLVVELTTAEQAEKAYAERGCHKLSLAEAEVKPVWEKLAAHGAASVAQPVTADPDLHLLVDGKRLMPENLGSGRYRFALKAGATQVVLASRAISPSASQPWLNDRRTLGVAVGGLRVIGESSSIPLALEGGLGWHDLERDSTSGRTWRWTDGAADLTLPTSNDERWLEVRVTGALEYPLEYPRLVASGGVAEMRAAG